MRVAGIWAAMAILALASSASPAPAAVTFGSNLGRAPNASTCQALLVPMSCTAWTTTLPGGSQAAGGTAAPSNGVIVGWQVRRAGGSSQPFVVALRVVRGSQGAGSGTQETLPGADATYAYTARLPVQTGDLLGLDLVGVPALDSVPIVYGSLSAGDFSNTAVLLPDGGSGVALPNLNSELAINATVEPDGDGDGYGDESQDSCPSDATTQGACSSGGSNGTGGGTTGAAPAPTGGGDSKKAPTVTLKAKPKQRLARLRFVATADQTVPIVVKAKLSVRKRSWKRSLRTKTVRTTLPAKTTTVRIRFGRRAIRKARALLRRGRRSKLHVTVSASGGAQVSSAGKLVISVRR